MWSFRSLLRRAMVCRSPGSPITWSPCMCVMKIFVILLRLVLAMSICLWTPSPQSNINCSPSRCNNIAGKLLFRVGTPAAVPRKMMRKLTEVTPFRTRRFLLLGFCEHRRNGTLYVYSLSLCLFGRCLVFLVLLCRFFFPC